MLCWRRVVEKNFHIIDLRSSLRVTTAEVLYYIPDHPHLLQSFVWQVKDEAPRFPRIERFLDHWRREIDAAIHSVRIAHVDCVRDWTAADVELRLHS